MPGSRSGCLPAFAPTFRGSRSYAHATIALAALAACACDAGEKDRTRDAAGDAAGTARPGEITEDVPLLDADGSVAAHGWARAPHPQYDRGRVQPSDLPMLREWEFYAIHSDAFSMSFTLSDLGALAFAIPTVEDYSTGTVHSGFMLAGPEALDLPSTPFGDTLFEASGGTFQYRFEEGRRLIDVVTAQVEAHVELEDSRDTDSIAVVHLLDEPGRFFYENKRLPMAATGSASAGGSVYELGPGSYGVLDWGRGSWPSMAKWQWAYFVGTADGHAIGVNLGTVFGNDTPGTADALFVDGVLHKLGRVEWTYDQDRVMDPWRFSSDDGRVDVVLAPDFDDSTTLPLGAQQRLDRWKVQGVLAGTIVRDDGSELRVDSLRGAAEYVEILW